MLPPLLHAIRSGNGQLQYVIRYSVGLASLASPPQLFVVLLMQLTAHSGDEEFAPQFPELRILDISCASFSNIVNRPRKLGLRLFFPSVSLPRSSPVQTTTSVAVCRCGGANPTLCLNWSFCE